MGAEIDEPDVLGITPFASACAKGLIPVVEALYRLSPSLITTCVTLSSGESWPPLFLSMGYGHRRVSEFIMSKSGPISLTYRDGDGRSALFMAISSGSYELADYLIDRVLASKSEGCRQLALQLLRRPNNANVTPLWLASLYGDVACVEWILSTLRSEFSYTQPDIEQYINTPDSRNASPLFVAVQEGSSECARYLIQNRAHLDSEPRLGWSVISPLVKACALGNLDLVKLLLHSGAQRFNDIQTIPVATAMEQWHIVRYLERRAGFVSRLHYAEELPSALVFDLVRAGADIHYTDGGVSPFQIAQSVIDSRKGSGRSIPIQLQYISRAGKPWSSENHCTFPVEARKLAIFLLGYFATVHREGIPKEVWIENILPFVIERGTPLSREETNRVRPGDGLPNRPPRYIQYST